jgi:acyl-coenzyme A thioesterase 13
MMRALRVHSASTTTTPSTSASAIFSLVPSTDLLNPRNTMHGGAIALLVDMCTTVVMAPLAQTGFWHFGGVTRTMSITCLRPIEAARQLWIECEVRAIGKRMCKQKPVPLCLSLYVPTLRQKLVRMAG